MSDKKISQLTAATTADGTEPLPIVQSGETKKATGKVVVSGAVSDLAQTWNAAGTTFTGLKLNVTDTASASGSKLLDVQKGGTSQLVLDKSGNLGLVVEPSAWGYTAAQVKTGSLWSTGGSNSYVGANYYHDGSSRRYISSAAATEYAQTAGQHIWKTAASGTAGNAVTFTNALTLDTSGNLGLGVTPSASTRPAIQVGATGTVGYLSLTSSGGVTSNQYFDGASHIYIGNGFSANYTQSSGSHFFYTAPSGTAGGTITFTERFSATTSAFVINDPGNDYDFRVEGDTDANLLFVDASTDRVGIGTNAPFGKLNVLWNSADSDQVRFTNTSSGSNNYLSFSVTGATGHNIPGWSNSGVIECVQSGATTGDKALYLGAFNGPILFATGSGSRNIRATLDTSGNLGLGTSTFGTSAAGVFAVKNGTAPTTGVADVLQIYSSDVSAGNTTLSIYTEGTPVSDSTDNAVTKKIAVRINGTLYYLLADTDNS